MQLTKETERPLKLTPTFVMVLTLCIFAQIADTQEKGSLKNPDSHGAASLVVADTVRKNSAQGRFTYRDDILTTLAEMGMPKSDIDLSSVGQRFPDVKEVRASTGTKCYYSSKTMSNIYVQILLRRDNPVPLVVDFVRESSWLYPRPVPLALFTKHPFMFSADYILKELGEMRKQGQFTDICQTVTSIGTIFFYSALYLDSHYAAMLAEWYDVGQSNNP